jgi:2-dehydropantoate 2-reductase
MGPVLSTERGRRLLADALHEVVLVSRRAGSSLTDEDEAKVRADLFAVPPTMRPSFMLDVERGGPAEVDLLSGTVARLGAAKAVATPVNATATAAFEVATLPAA